MSGRTLGRTVVVLAWLAATALTPTPALAQTRPPKPQPTVELVSQPIIVAPDGVFPVVLSITDAPAGGELAVDIYDRVDKVANLADAVTKGAPAATFLPPVPLAEAPIARTQTAAFAIQLFVPGEQRPTAPFIYGIAEPGVYPIRVRVRNADHDNIGTFTTTLTRAPEADQETGHADVAVVPVIHAPPPLDPAARATNDAAGPRLAAALPQFLDGFAGHGTVPASFAVTPDTAARLAGDPTTAATADALRLALAGEGRQLLDAPFVDIDPAQLVTTGQTSELADLRDLGRITLAGSVGDPAQGTWYLPRSVDPGAVPFLRLDGIDRLVLPTGALTGAPPRRAFSLPSGDGQVTAVAAETVLVDQLADASDPVRAAHQLLARLTLLAANAPGSQLVLPLDPRVDSQSLRVLLDALAFGTPWIGAVTLDQVFADAVPAPVGVAIATQPARELSGYSDAVAETGADLASYRSMTVAPAPGAASGTDDDQAFTRSLAFSAAIDLPVEQRVAELRAVQARAGQRFSAITISSREKVTLGSRQARFPLTISSNLQTPLRVLVEFAANDRLEFPQEPIPVIVGGGRTVVQVPVRTRTSGDTPATITVRSPDGRVILAEGRYTIRSTSVSGGGVILTLGAVAFLALWWGRHWRRSRRATGPKRARALAPARGL